MKKLFLLIFVLVMGLSVSAQQSVQKTVIQTNGVCEQCKKKMMENVPTWKGVQQCSYDVTTAKLTIVYDANKTNLDQLRKQVSLLGYDADNVKADAAAREKLPACCRNAKPGQGCGGHSSGGCGGCNHHH